MKVYSKWITKIILLVLFVCCIRICWNKNGEKWIKGEENAFTFSGVDPVQSKNQNLTL